MIETIYLEGDKSNELEQTIMDWSAKIGAESLVLDSKKEMSEQLDGFVILHHDYDISKDHEHLSDVLDKNNVPTLKVDLSGTLVALTTSFSMWIDLNKAKRVLISGTKSVNDAEKLASFFDKVGAK